MKTKTPLIAALLSASYLVSVQAEPPLPPPPEPLARVAQNSIAPPVAVEPKESVVPPTDDEFSQSLASLRKELESVRVVRQQTAPMSGAHSEVDSAVSAVRQRRQLLDLLQKLATSGPRKADARQQQKVDKKSDTNDDNEAVIALDIGDKVNDPFGLGKSLFKLGDFVRAEQAFRLVPSNGSNEWQMKYLIASCLRKQKKLPDAIGIYQDIILHSGDSMLQDSSRWQLSNMRWQQTMDQQLKRLRELQHKPEIDTSELTDPKAGTAPPAPAAPKVNGT